MNREELELLLTQYIYDQLKTGTNGYEVFYKAHQLVEDACYNADLRFGMEDSMRAATLEDLESVDKYIQGISKPARVNF